MLSIRGLGYSLHSCHTPPTYRSYGTASPSGEVDLGSRPAQCQFNDGERKTAWRNIEKLGILIRSLPSSIQLEDLCLALEGLDGDRGSFRP